MPNTWDISSHFKTRCKSDAGNFAQRRVRLLRSSSVIVGLRVTSLPLFKTVHEIFTSYGSSCHNSLKLQGLLLASAFYYLESASVKIRSYIRLSITYQRKYAYHTDNNEYCNCQLFNYYINVLLFLQFEQVE
jgi:hypothetical protein